MNVPHRLKTFLDDVLLKAIGDIGEGILVVEGSRIVYANETFQRMTGYSEEQLLALSSFFNLLDDSHKEKHQEKIIAFRKNPKGLLRFQAALRADRNQVLSVEITLTVLKDDPQDRMVALIRDITDQKRLQEAVKDQEFQYKLLFKNNPNPMFIYDLESLAILSVNDAAILKYGYTEKEFLGMTLKDLRREEDVPKLLKKSGQPEKRRECPEGNRASPQERFHDHGSGGHFPFHFI